MFVSLQCVSHGELLVSLSYQPVSHRLSVVVLKAKHLPKLDITGMSGSKFTELSAHTHLDNLDVIKMRTFQRLLLFFIR